MNSEKDRLSRLHNVTNTLALKGKINWILSSKWGKYTHNCNQRNNILATNYRFPSVGVLFSLHVWGRFVAVVEGWKNTVSLEYNNHQNSNKSVRSFHDKLTLILLIIFALPLLLLLILFIPTYITWLISPLTIPQSPPLPGILLPDAVQLLPCCALCISHISFIRPCLALFLPHREV